MNLKPISHKQKQFWARAVAALIVVGVVLLQPKIESWLADQEAVDATVVEGSESVPDASADVSEDTASNTAAIAKAPPGKLSLIAGTRDEFVSTAGLLYLPGSADGHRLKHVLKHASDDTSKPVHGVFAGDRDQILAWIDTAFELAGKGGKDVRRADENGRTIYSVDLGEKIGFVGGQVGLRKDHPPCHYLRLVVEDDIEVITAYPTDRL